MTFSALRPPMRVAVAKRFVIDGTRELALHAKL